MQMILEHVRREVAKGLVLGLARYSLRTETGLTKTVAWVITGNGPSADASPAITKSFRALTGPGEAIVGE